MPAPGGLAAYGAAMGEADFIGLLRGGHSAVIAVFNKCFQKNSMGC
jgi:hypothetical protein